MDIFPNCIYGYISKLLPPPNLPAYWWYKFLEHQNPKLPCYSDYTRRQISQVSNCISASESPQRKAWPWVGIDVVRPSNLWLACGLFLSLNIAWQTTVQLWWRGNSLPLPCYSDLQRGLGALWGEQKPVFRGCWCQRPLLLGLLLHMRVYSDQLS